MGISRYCVRIRTWFQEIATPLRARNDSSRRLVPLFDAVRNPHRKKGTALWAVPYEKHRYYSSTYWMAMQPGPPWVMKAGDRGTTSNCASGMAERSC